MGVAMRVARTSFLAISVIAACWAIAPIGVEAAGVTFTVNRIGDAPDLHHGDGKCDTSTNSGNQCTLRAAIQETNATPSGPIIINFNISSSATVKVISPASPLPHLNHAATINGYSQPGTSPNGRMSGDDAVLKIVLNGVNAGSSANGLVVNNNGPTLIEGLVIQRFGGSGISLVGSHTKVEGNFIGTNAGGTTAAANGVGVTVTGAQNVIGESHVGALNIVSGNSGDGILVTGNDAAQNTILGDYIGTTKSGSSALANGGDGIDVAGGSALIGANGSGNLVSGNTGSGIRVSTTSSGTQIQTNLVGTDATGMAALGNQRQGVDCAGSAGLSIGGTAATMRNVISANGAEGMLLSSCPNSTIQGNFIGTDEFGSVVLGNKSAGINIVNGTGVIVGGTASGAGNVISGNGGDGIFVQLVGVNPGGSETIQGNRIGTGAAGSADLGNHGNGITLATGNSNTVGGTGGGNSIFFNFNGIVIESGSNTVSNNAIESNDDVGIFVAASSNVIGGNAVIGNTLEGVFVQQGTGNRITENVMGGNGRLGIDLHGGSENSSSVTANDTDDPDKGPNGLQNFPVLASAIHHSNSVTTVSASLNSLPSTSFRIEFFVADASPSGHGEGFIALGSTTITTGSDGNKAFTFNTAQVSAGQQITATAIETSTGNTSEFSSNVVVVNGS
jgi:parallel beta-helix repeat protein